MPLIMINMIEIIDRGYGGTEEREDCFWLCMCVCVFYFFYLKRGGGEFGHVYQLDDYIYISLLGMHLRLCRLFDCLSFGLVLRLRFHCLLLLLLRCSLMFLLEGVICKRTSQPSMCKEELLSILDNGTKIEQQYIQIFLNDLPGQFLYHLFSRLNR